ncbi:hypothetical protein A0H81_08073 [Grifola frondosa]|uniref:Uncharacterized protein n=1 Tax=Grifola frondosa TaxID=5627 RepID=A0A1C7M6H6_GRIFR|nr:hypothetical protein A0H81_08073 [Grifola frondosa]
MPEAVEGWMPETLPMWCIHSEVKDANVAGRPSSIPGGDVAVDREETLRVNSWRQELSDLREMVHTRAAGLCMDSVQGLLAAKPELETQLISWPKIVRRRHRYEKALKEWEVQPPRYPSPGTDAARSSSS